MPPLLPHARRATATSVGCRVAYVISPARAKCYRDGGWRVDCRFTSPACAKGYLCGGDGPEATRRGGQRPGVPCMPLRRVWRVSASPLISPGLHCLSLRRRPRDAGESVVQGATRGTGVGRPARSAGRRMRRPAKYEGRSGTKVSRARRSVEYEGWRARRAVTFPSESMTFVSFLICDIYFFCEHRPGLDPAQASPADPCRSRAWAGVPRMCPGIRRVTA